MRSWAFVESTSPYLQKLLGRCNAHPKLRKVIRIARDQNMGTNANG